MSTRLERECSVDMIHAFQHELLKEARATIGMEVFALWQVLHFIKKVGKKLDPGTAMFVQRALKKHRAWIYLEDFLSKEEHRVRGILLEDAGGADYKDPFDPYHSKPEADYYSAVRGYLRNAEEFVKTVLPSDAMYELLKECSEDFSDIENKQDSINDSYNRG